MNFGEQPESNYPLFFFVPKYRTSGKMDIKDQCKKRCSKFSEVLAHQCQRYRDSFLKHMANRDDVQLVVTSGTEYLKSFYGFVAEPNLKKSPTDKNELVTSEASEGSLSNLPISKLRYVIKSSFKTSLCKDHGGKFQDSFYEASCALFNIMVGKMLVINDSCTKCEYKEAFAKSREVWGICQFLENCYFKDPYNKNLEIPFDMSRACFSALGLMIHAQMNEIAIHLTLEKEKKFKLIAQLSRGVQEAYYLACSKIESQLETKWKCPELECWVNYLKLKAQLYKIFQYAYTAIDCSETKITDSLAIMNHIIHNKELSELEILSKLFVKKYWRKRTNELAKIHCEFISNCVLSNKRVLENDNAMIYEYQKPSEELPDWYPVTKIGSSVPFNLPDPSSQWNEYPLFHPSLPSIAENSDDEEEKEGFCVIL